MTGGRACVFCGSTGTLTREHVFGDWLSKIGLEDVPVQSVAGSLNQIGKRMGESRPFQTKVKNVCGTCNNGWMSRLETVAQRVLTPLALGQPGLIEVADQAPLAMWIHKTALMAMYLSSAADREAGHGVPPSEYASLYQQRASMEPLPNSRFWIARYTGRLRLGTVWVTPVAVNQGLPEPDFPHGYAMTIAVGAILLHGVRFTDLPFAVDVATQRTLSEIWPASDDVEWPVSIDVSDDDFLGLAQGREFVLAEREMSLRPMSFLMDSPQSELVGLMVEMPTPCGQGHTIYFPSALAEEGMRGKFHWFKTECKCGIAYLVHTERTGAHVKSAGEPVRIAVEYDTLAGSELIYRDSSFEFGFKEDASP
ncbi:hypothetical protein E3O44_17145 [Cryobacterium algoricola]|uniref:Uncharacterized protein n=1 Tax=Cryobacterium algoricola TaxID=1259183 RepID=A0ABY2I9A3_9MICO|nr:hypothetical protein [Cryobacterium algoricola]TFB83601.1 hypothetical protein E3O44_17145 [Cryobacterium algoricola]